MWPRKLRKAEIGSLQQQLDSERSEVVTPGELKRRALESDSELSQHLAPATARPQPFSGLFFEIEQLFLVIFQMRLPKRRNAELMHDVACFEQEMKWLASCNTAP